MAVKKKQFCKKIRTTNLLCGIEDLSTSTTVICDVSAFKYSDFVSELICVTNCVFFPSPVLSKLFSQYFFGNTSLESQA